MEKELIGKIIKISGPLVVAKDVPQVKMYELVKVGEEKLIGEVIRIDGEMAYIQVYEETSGLAPGAPVFLTGNPLSVELGPGLISSIYDGIQRPLQILEKKSGSFITRGIEASALDFEKKWHFKPLKKVGEIVRGGDIFGEVQETEIFVHKIMVPPHFKEGKINFIVTEGNYHLNEPIAQIGEEKVFMYQKWPIRKPRPIKEKNVPFEGLITGQRVIDTFFPIAKGGTACVPGPFGSGKTVVQHQIAKWANANVVIFVGCGERGNEMTDILKEFPHLKDPATNRPLLERTVLIANTSNMPVSAREASIYTGITIGEYFRDMGYSVVFLADSTSRWAEALREISGRLEEMPGEEGYPAYLASKISAFYERSGQVKCLATEERLGSLTVIGSVSPPGGDFSEPVTQNTLRVTKVFWALDSSLAYKRHFPAINWLTSYSLYEENLQEFFLKEGEKGFNEVRKKAKEILQKEAQLQEIVQLVGVESLSKEDQFLLEVARMIREDFLQQNAFDEIDAYSSLRKQALLLTSIIQFYYQGLQKIKEGKTVEEIVAPQVKENVSSLKYIKENELNKFQSIIKEIC